MTQSESQMQFAMVIVDDSENPCMPSSNGLLFNEPVACIQDFLVMDEFLRGFLDLLYRNENAG